MNSYIYTPGPSDRKPAALTTGSRTDLTAEDDDRTRKGETIKWLENHFGSESRSSKDDDFEETKKSYFNVTIKSNPSSVMSPSPAAAGPAAGAAIYSMPAIKKYHQSSDYNSNLISPSKVIIPERESTMTPTNNKSSKYSLNDWQTAEHREYNNTRRSTVSPINRFIETTEQTRHPVGGGSISPTARIVHHRIVRDEIPSSLKTNRIFSSKSDLRYQRNDDGDDRLNNNNYTQSLKRDAKHRSESREQLYSSKTRRDNNDLYRSDSPPSTSFIGSHHRLRDEPSNRNKQHHDRGDNERLYESKFKKSSVQRNDSNYFNSQQSPNRTPSAAGSIIIDNNRDTTPVNFDSDYVRPSVPQRRRILERKLQLNAKANGTELKKHDEPAPDYNSSPSRSRSHSPVLHHTNSAGHKRYQRARFASEPARSIVTKSTSTEIPTKSGSSLSLKPSRVGSAITNSIRKFFGKIRSASSGRKLKLKPKRSIASSSDIQPSRTSDFGSTYQQYYVIDGHIGNGKRASVSSSRTKSDRNRGNSDMEPKQKYYLGEDPYGGGTYGKENKYDGSKFHSNNSGNHSSRRSQSNDVDRSSPLR